MLVALAFMKGLCTQGVPLTSDAPLRARYCLMCALTAKLMTMPSDQIALMFRHFYVVEAHAEGVAKVIYHVEGVATPPANDDQLASAMTTCMAVYNGGDPTQLLDMAARCFTIIDGVPNPAGTPALDIGRMLRTVLCSTGASVPTGRAPPGPLVRKVRNRRGGRGANSRKHPREKDFEDSE